MSNNTFIRRALVCLEKLDKLEEVSASRVTFYAASALVYALLSIGYELAALRSER
jgi:hypothetical protein